MSDRIRWHLERGYFQGSKLDRMAEYMGCAPGVLRFMTGDVLGPTGLVDYWLLQVTTPLAVTIFLIDSARGGFVRLAKGAGGWAFYTATPGTLGVAPTIHELLEGKAPGGYEDTRYSWAPWKMWPWECPKDHVAQDALYTE